MNADIDQMITGRLVLMKIVIQGKADVADGSGPGRIFTESRIPEVVHGQFLQAYGRVVFNP